MSAALCPHPVRGRELFPGPGPEGLAAGGGGRG